MTKSCLERNIPVCSHSFSPDEWNLITEVFATAILFSKDETGDFVRDAVDLARSIGIDMKELRLMRVKVKALSG